MKFLQLILLFLLSLSNISCQQTEKSTEVLFGADLLLSDYPDLIKEKNIGLVINQTSVLKNGTPLLDTLLSLKINIKAIFSPEHGFKGTGEAGELQSESVYALTVLKIFSLYGKDKKPTPAMLKDIDLLIFDLQDVGARFYTYISTLYYVIEAAAENKIPLLVLDSPNPLGGLNVEGPVLQNKFKSFIGITELPIVHGMTIGELANFFSDEINLSGNAAEVSVIKIKNWERNFVWRDLNRDWVPTSPNIPDFETALIYPATCLLEGTNISEGRGTKNPFKVIGAPFLDSEEIIGNLSGLNLDGIEFKPVTFVPENIPGKASNPKYENVSCNGIHIKVVDYTNFSPIVFGINLINVFQKLYPGKFQFKDDHFDKLIGTDTVRKMLVAGDDPEAIIKSWGDDLLKFKEKRKQYLLY